MATLKKAKALKRLASDYDQLKKEPLVGANAEPYGDDMMTWYGIVEGGHGTEYEGIPIRFCLEFPDDYPENPPNGFFETYVAYEGGATYKDEKNRLGICLNIFGNFNKLHSEWKTMSEGWTPSYTVTSILTSMQGLMMSSMLSTRKEHIEKSRTEANKFICKITGHNGSDRTKWFPQLMTSDEFKKIKETSVKIDRKFDPLVDHYICYVKKTTSKDGAVFGYGVNVDNPKTGMISSPCEYLSEEAYDEGIRRSSLNKTFTDFLPILIRSDDWKKVKPMFFSAVRELFDALSVDNKKKSDSEAVFKICSAIMNSLVVEIMNNANKLTANDKFIDGYFALYRLMKQYSIDDRSIIDNANRDLETFKNKPDMRSKKFIPNLGELLIQLTLSDKLEWKDIAEYFIHECDARNFMWYAIGNRTNYPKYPELKDAKVVVGRSKKVFDATEISRKLVMFQVKFAQVAKLLTIEEMDSNYGLAPSELRKIMRELYNDISVIKDWKGYFEFLGMISPTDDERDKQLVDAVNTSKMFGYHK